MSDDTAIDMVNHPPHYTSHPIFPGECIDYTRHMGFNRGNAFKYLWRFRDKFDPTEDLRKAIFYIRDTLNHNHADDVMFRTQKKELPEEILTTHDTLMHIVDIGKPAPQQPEHIISGPDFGITDVMLALLTLPSDELYFAPEIIESIIDSN